MNVARPIRFCLPLLLLVGFMAAIMWAKASDPFQRVEFTLKTVSGGKVKGIAVLPKPIGKHPVVIYLQGAGGSLLGSGNELRQVAELGLAAVGLEYDQTNQSRFDEQFIALHQYLQQQSWAQSNATAWVGFSLGAQRTLSFALRHPEYQPQLLVRRAGGWVGELGEKLEIQNVKFENGVLPSLPSTTNPQPSTLIKCPVLLIDGERDKVFPVADCKRLAEQVRANGTSVEVRLFPESGHGFGEDSGPVVRALLHLAVSGCLFATRDPMKQGLVAGWAGLNYIVYLAGMAWLKTAASIPAVVVVAWELGVSEKTVQIVWRLFIAYLIVIGLLLLVMEWRRLKRLEAEEFLKRWHESREREDKAQ